MLSKLLNAFNDEVYSALIVQPLVYQPEFVQNFGINAMGLSFRVAAMAAELSAPAFAAYTIYSIAPVGTKDALSKLSFNSISMMLPSFKDVSSKLSLAALTKLFSSTSTLKTSGATYLTAAFGLFTAHYAYNTAANTSLLAASWLVDADRSDPKKSDSKFTKMVHPITQFLKNYVLDITTILVQQHNGGGDEEVYEPRKKYHFGGSAETNLKPFKRFSYLLEFGTAVGTTALACTAFAKAVPLMLGKGNVVEVGKLLGATMGAAALTSSATNILKAVFEEHSKYRD